MPLGWPLLILRSLGQRSRSNCWSLNKCCPLNISWPFCLKIANLSIADAPWELMFPMMFRSKVKVKPKCCVLIIIRVKLWIKFKQLTANHRNAASQKLIVAYFAIKPKRKDLLASNLLNHQFEPSMHICNPFEFCTRGLFMFLKHFLFTFCLDICFKIHDLYTWSNSIHLCLYSFTCNIECFKI